MDNLEKKAEEYAKKKFETIGNFLITDDIAEIYKDGYEKGQKDFDTDVTKLLNSYGVKFIDTNSIGGLIALHQLMLDLEKENEELKERLKEITMLYENMKSLYMGS